MTYLITGATGEVGTRVVKQLVERGSVLECLFGTERRHRRGLVENVDVWVGDLGDRESLTAALRGVECALPGDFGSDRFRCWMSLRHAQPGLQTCGHVVKLSSLDVEQSLAIGAWHEQRRGGNSSELESSLTFLRPSGFMTNLLAWARFDSGRKA